MEYLLVEFSEIRGVVIDDVPQGMTNSIIELEAGTRTIVLEAPSDFEPDSHEVVLQDTTPLDPMRVSFNKV